MAKTRVIYGAVGPDGTVITEGGFVNGDSDPLPDRLFEVAKIKDGVYEIVFITQFGAVPSVTATQVYSSDDGSHGDTRDNVVIVHIDKDRARFACGDSNGDATNREFCFQAMGRAEPIR